MNMEGSKFKGKRESIEKLYDEINSLIEEKSIQDAKKKLKKTRKMLDLLNSEELSEIQERSTFNLKIKGDYLAANIDKIMS